MPELTQSVGDFRNLLEQFKRLAPQRVQKLAHETKPNHLREFGELLLTFGRLPKREKRPFKTFLEIAGFPHRELTCSNILAFFLDSTKEHGLGNLVLESLLEAVGSELASTSFRSVKVKREEQRIDLVIITDSCVIGIENKLFAGLYNPLKVYCERLTNIANDHQVVVPILLTLREEADTENLCGFKPITYDKFFEVLQRRIGKRILNADHRCWVFFLDFIATIQNLKQDIHMNKETRDFFKGHADRALEFFWYLTDVSKELASMARSVSDELEVPACFSKRGIYESLDDDREATDIYCTFYYDTYVAGVLVRMEAMVSINGGWKIYFLSLNDENEFGKVRAWLSQHGIQPCRQDSKEWIYEEFDFSIDEQQVQSKCQELLYAIGLQVQKHELLKDLIRQTPGLELDDCEKHYVRFAAKDWKNSPALIGGKNWTSSKLMLLFEFDGFLLDLYIGPGAEKIQDRIFNLAQKNKKIFRKCAQKLNRGGGDWTPIFETELITKEDIKDGSQTERMMRERWANFVKNDLPSLTNAIKGERKLWEP